MSYLKWLMGLIAILVLGSIVFTFYMRIHDGPIEIFAGGPFKSGDLVSGIEPDWRKFKDRDTIEFQMLEPVRSRTTWLVVYEGKLYTLSSYMNSKIGKMWKHWPHQAEKDGRALLRIDGKIYKRQMNRVPANNAAIPTVVSEINRKYKTGTTIEDIKANGTWIFELAPRS